MRRTRHHARTRARGKARVIVSIALGLVLLGGGGAFAAYRYDAATSTRLLPGVTIEQVDVGEMTRAQAIAALEETRSERLDRPIEVQAGERTWTVTPAELGATADVEGLVDRALALNEDHAWPDRVFRRLADRSVEYRSGLQYRYNERRVRRFVRRVAGQVEVSPSDAAVEFEDGELVLRKPKVGRRMAVKRSIGSLLEAMQDDGDRVEFRLKEVRPEVRVRDLGYTIVVDLSETKLHLYKGLKLQKTYRVAVGQAAYPTPQGSWTVINKRANPTWVNPQPDGWGANLPRQIGPGPGNPLGTRALDLNAPGIRIHGTYASSSIGTAASHGCVRMLIPQSEELFDIVPVGTRAHIVA
jgi:lipoprotein-anchoring transpeptidase ErfK/SrfK